MFRSVTYCLFALAMTAGWSAVAGAEGEVDQIVHMDGPGIAEPVSGNLSLQQRRDLYAPRGPRPGLYKIRALHSGKCIGHHAALGLENSYLLHSDCAWSTLSWFVLPHPDGGYTVRTNMDHLITESRANVPGQIGNCATVARGVVFGPARIDLKGCDLPTGAGDWSVAGTDDQRFMILPVGQDTYEFKTLTGGGDNGDCWSVRGASRDKADLIRWGCNSGSDQRFMLEWQGPVTPGFETGLLARTRWAVSPDGPRRLSPANGVDLQGVSYSSFETIADNGDYCMKRCAELANCKAWTWSAAGYGGNSKPICQWKNGGFTPINRGKSAMGKLFSGIIRP
ncbi:PAN domain-containing protein [Sphingorhabdus pulchriflava]|nr:PAN domain-containing protein [Sphingorhabdus pulchriflava]